MRRKLKNVTQYDSQTGELLEGVLVYCNVKRNPYNKGWVMNSQEALDLLAEDKDLTKDALRVFLKLCARLDFENWIQITQKELAEELKIDRTNISKAISLLIKKEILLRGPKLGQTFAYRLNPDYGWKGKVVGLEDYRRQRDDQEQKRPMKLVPDQQPESLINEEE